jgi:alpha-amylase/alpha-mannosidase (GH57 family)
LFITLNSPVREKESPICVLKRPEKDWTSYIRKRGLSDMFSFRYSKQFSLFVSEFSGDFVTQENGSIIAFSNLEKFNEDKLVMKLHSLSN